MRFGKKDYFHDLVFYMGYFIKEIENIFPVFPLVEVWKNSKLRGNTRTMGSCSHSWKFERTRNCVEILALRVRVPTRASLRELEIAWKYSHYGFVFPLVQVWENSKLGGNTRTTGSCSHSCKFERTRNCVETLALRVRVPTSISRSPKLPLVFL